MVPPTTAEQDGDTRSQGNGVDTRIWTEGLLSAKREDQGGRHRTGRLDVTDRRPPARITRVPLRLAYMREETGRMPASGPDD